MNANIAQQPQMIAEPIADDPDYRMVSEAIAYVSEHWQEQPSLAAMARHVGLEPLAFQRRFTRLAGLTPKTFLQSVTLDRARALLASDSSVMEASFELGLSGPGRLHDLLVSNEAMTPGDLKRRGEGLTLEWGIHQTPFGHASIIVRGDQLVGLGFVDAGEAGQDAIAEFTGRWRRANFVRDDARTAPFAARVFDRREWHSGNPLRIVLIGTDFEIRVWRALLKVPFAGATSYGAVAAEIGRPSASRAVGAAIGRNPISFVVPCHRVIGRDGSLTGYLWGLPRKRAILGWEAGIAAESAG